MGQRERTRRTTNCEVAAIGHDAAATANAPATGEAAATANAAAATGGLSARASAAPASEQAAGPGAPAPARPRPTFTLLVLLGINAVNFYDRQVLGAVAEPLKRAWDLSDFQLGNLATAFTLLYAFAGIPLGRLADRLSRKAILALGVGVWSSLTVLSGFACDVASLFVMRLGVGIGEASCAPAATSLLGDLFPRERRGRALAVFMLGLPLGIFLSFVVSGHVAERWGWRAAFWVAGLPGPALALLALALPEPPRGAGPPCSSEPGRLVRSILAVLQAPAMLWIILSGAVHNFVLYGLSTFIAPLLSRYHGLTTAQAGWAGGIAFGLFGGAGILAGGWLADRLAHRAGGRLAVAAAALLAAATGLLLALWCPRGAAWRFAACVSAAILLSYVYYPAVYAAIQDQVIPRLRGTAMAVYFAAMYLLGASVGSSALGWLSDACARQLAGSAATPGPEQLAAGLHQAMYLLPALDLVVVLVLAAGVRAAGRGGWAAGHPAARV